MVNGISGNDSAVEVFRAGRSNKRSSLFSVDMRMPSAQQGGSGAPGASTNGSVPAAAASQTDAAFTVPRQNSVASPVSAAPLYAWREDVTAVTTMDDGSTRVDPVNPRQFATAETAQALANQLGLKSYGLNLAGFSSYTADVQMLNPSGNPQEAGLNAGLVADTFARYGSGAGTLGQYMIDRDLAMLRGETIPDPYANR
jgi:hypothetical protein